ncbi:hypothetical protein QBC33DRAFT_168403 [Phialemonium atrogriseum]|uniref:Uncharacterized protein n=1 Tax=Phialemonium atrogriseum TaxID=1093897 RepID=A0AAJ0C7X3_9PEZI|nr:uncharacterized protein QBC33DRAFT_168403 [Phialemonium atrogriseum]KAK1771803.1 hypothetical protein QBC33DRAFT_168403 [Phialemonium atrogriseum]
MRTNFFDMEADWTPVSRTAPPDFQTFGPIPPSISGLGAQGLTSLRGTNLSPLTFGPAPPLISGLQTQDWVSGLGTTHWGSLSVEPSPSPAAGLGNRVDANNGLSNVGAWADRMPTMIIDSTRPFGPEVAVAGSHTGLTYPAHGTDDAFQRQAEHQQLCHTGCPHGYIGFAKEHLRNMARAIEKGELALDRYRLADLLSTAHHMLSIAEGQASP